MQRVFRRLTHPREISFNRRVYFVSGCRFARTGLLIRYRMSISTVIYTRVSDNIRDCIRVVSPMGQKGRQRSANERFIQLIRLCDQPVHLSLWPCQFFPPKMSSFFFCSSFPFAKV